MTGVPSTQRVPVSEGESNDPGTPILWSGMMTGWAMMEAANWALDGRVSPYPGHWEPCEVLTPEAGSGRLLLGDSGREAPGEMPQVRNGGA